MSNVLDHDEILRRRTAIHSAILDLERGKIAQQQKLAEVEFCRGRLIPGTKLTYDDDALDRQKEQAERNIGTIEATLVAEHLKLKAAEGDLAASHAILKLHGTTACLLGSEPHKWVVTQRHLSGAFAKRHCSVCGTEQKIGVP